MTSALVHPPAVFATGTTAALDVVVFLSPKEAVFHALRVYGPARDKELIRRLREIASNDQRTPRMSAHLIVQTRRALVRDGVIQRRLGAPWRVFPEFLHFSLADALRWAGCCHNGPRRWLEHHGVRIERGYAVVYKAVRTDFVSPHGVRYAPGDRPAAKDWHDRAECDGGLFFWPTPRQANSYLRNGRIVACRVRVDHLVTIGIEKCKAPRCTVLYECDPAGNRLCTAEAAA